MKTIKYLLFTFFILSNFSFAQETYKPLFKIYENGLYGYIDSTGTIIIPPKFKGAGEFSEGLAPVRENGYYGYIDETGKYVFHPQYDYAESFKNGFAKVNISGNANIIDKAGNKMISVNCVEVKELIDNKATIRTKTYKRGVVDLKGNVIIDTLYDEISDFHEGIYIVNNYNGPYCAIDTNGNIIVPFGKYVNISDFRNGFSIVSWNTNNHSQDMSSKSYGIIDRTGKLLFWKLNSPGFSISSSVSIDSTFIVNEYQYTLFNNGSVSWDKKLYGGIMDIKGNLVAKEPDGYELRYFDGKIYYRDSIGRYFLIDKNGKFTGKTIFVDDWNRESYYKFERIEKDGISKYGIIDTSLNFILKPMFVFSQRPNENDQFVFGNYFSKGNYKEGERRFKLGISDIHGNIILQPEYDEIEYKDNDYNIILVIKEGTPEYIDKSGKVLWKKKKSTNGNLFPLDIDYQMTNNYRIDKSKAWQPESTGSIDKIDKNITNNEFQILIDDKENLNFLNKFYGISLFIINNTDNTILSSSMDACLPMVFQAKDMNGKWIDIENNSSQFCVMSESIIHLKANTYWKFSIPSYKGGFSTKLRMKIEIIEDNNKSKNIYSNEITGSINPAQFWRNIGWWHINNILEK